MLVMIANALGREAVRLAERFPGRVGHIYGLGDSGWKTPRAMFPYALDNGRYPVWKRGGVWPESEFRALCAKAARAELKPRWLAVPDVVADRAATLASWRAWSPELRALGWPLAFVVQDGMGACDVPADADVVFVGGTTTFKMATLREWCRLFPRVHIGRINGERPLWRCHHAGAESCDGSGWFRGDPVQLAGLWRYLEHSSAIDGQTGAPRAELLPLFASP